MHLLNTNPYILKLELLIHGVNINHNVLSNIHLFNPKFGHGLFLYHDEKIFNNFQQIPQELVLDGSVIVQVRTKPNSPFVIDYSDNKKLSLFKNNKFILPIDFIKKPKFYDQLIDKETYVKQIMQLAGYDCLQIYPLNYCFFESTNDLCLFCNVNQSNNLLHIIKQKKLEQISKAYKIVEKFEKFNHIMISGGTFPGNDRGAKFYEKLLKKIKDSSNTKKILPTDVSLVPPDEIEWIDKLFSQNIDTISMNIEVWDSKLFKLYCPGKDKIGINKYLSIFKYITKNYGEWKSRSNFVLGLENIKKFLEGCESLAEIGVIPTTKVLALNPGTKITEMSFNVPPLEFFLEAYNGLLDIYKKYNIKPIWCNNCNSWSLDHELTKLLSPT